MDLMPFFFKHPLRDPRSVAFEVSGGSLGMGLLRRRPGLASAEKIFLSRFLYFRRDGECDGGFHFGRARRLSAIPASTTVIVDQNRA